MVHRLKHTELTPCSRENLFKQYSGWFRVLQTDSIQSIPDSLTSPWWGNSAFARKIALRNMRSSCFG
ncbi:MAG: hypothetical protein HQ557_13765 [Bacteroidetes bacterium]|nr:hypothetical protein [Bacteroidota bacterium]